ncbi:hypothetical protein DFS34DRAFT_595449 [Phlyctochytrium arcticum]|nr:hypothetical protein DFS34DRAFT_595449 [Phlyctochytrium arcticum]
MSERAFPSAVQHPESPASSGTSRSYTSNRLREAQELARQEVKILYRSAHTSFGDENISRGTDASAGVHLKVEKVLEKNGLLRPRNISSATSNLATRVDNHRQENVDHSHTYAWDAVIESSKIQRPTYVPKKQISKTVDPERPSQKHRVDVGAGKARPNVFQPPEARTKRDEVSNMVRYHCVTDQLIANGINSQDQNPAPSRGPGIFSSPQPVPRQRKPDPLSQFAFDDPKPRQRKPDPSSQFVFDVPKPSINRSKSGLTMKNKYTEDELSLRLRQSDERLLRLSTRYHEQSHARIPKKKPVRLVRRPKPQEVVPESEKKPSLQSQLLQKALNTYLQRALAPPVEKLAPPIPGPRTSVKPVTRPSSKAAANRAATPDLMIQQPEREPSRGAKIIHPLLDDAADDLDQVLQRLPGSSSPPKKNVSIDAESIRRYFDRAIQTSSPQKGSPKLTLETEHKPSTIPKSPKTSPTKSIESSIIIPPKPPRKLTIRPTALANLEKSRTEHQRYLAQLVGDVADSDSSPWQALDR